MQVKFAAATLLAFVLAVPIISVNAQAQDLQVALLNNVMVGEFGGVFLNETFSVYNPTTSPISLPSLILNLPQEYNQKVADVLVTGPVSFSHTVLTEGGFVKIRITPQSDYQVSTGANVSIHMQVATSVMTEISGSGQYRAFGPLFPSSNILLSKVRSNLVIPRGVTFSNQTQRFNKTDFGGLEAQTGVMNNVAPTDVRSGFFYFVPRPDIAQFTVAEFSEVSRTITVRLSGHVSVKDKFRIANKGFGDITSIRVHPISSDIKNITIASVEEPPLKNPVFLSLVNSRIDMQSAYGQPVKQGESMLIHYEYAVKANSTDGILFVNMLTTPPVDALVSGFAINSQVSQSFRLIQGERSVLLPTSSPLATNIIAYKFRPSISWAFIDVFPIATGLFIMIFLSLLTYSMKRRGGITEIEEKLEDLIRIYEEKVSLTGTAIAELKAEDLDRLQRKQFDNTRNSIAGIRSRSSQRAADARRVVLQSMPQMQKSLSDLANLDQSYDRVVQQYLQAYDQHLARRMTREIFRSTLSRVERDLNNRTNDLIAFLSRISGQEGSQ
jgi:hypothetical protein